MKSSNNWLATILDWFAGLFHYESAGVRKLRTQRNELEKARVETCRRKESLEFMIQKTERRILELNEKRSRLSGALEQGVRQEILHALSLREGRSAQLAEVNRQQARQEHAIQTIERILDLSVGHVTAENWDDLASVLEEHQDNDADAEAAHKDLLALEPAAPPVISEGEIEKALAGICPPRQRSEDNLQNSPERSSVSVEPKTRWEASV